MSSKVKCLILDDELPSLTYLRMLCEQLPFVEVERCFDSPGQFLKEYGQLEFDVCLLDIHMPGISGIEIAQLLRDKAVVFISAHPEFAVEAFDLEAIDFIRKPVTRERLEKALQKVRNTLATKDQKDYFIWNSQLGKSTVYFSQIQYITVSTSDKRDKQVYLAGNNELLLKNITIDKLLELLPPRQFIRINKSDVVSRKAIQAYTSEDVMLNRKSPSGSQLMLPLGETYKKEFLQFMQ